MFVVQVVALMVVVGVAGFVLEVVPPVVVFVVACSVVELGALMVVVG